MTRLALFAVLVSGMLTAQTKKVNLSEIKWWGYKVAKTESSSHYGTLGLKSGEITVKRNKVVGGTFVLDMNTINTTDLQGDAKAKLDGHLKHGDFFEVEKYPTAVYKITSVKHNAPNKQGFNATVHGQLTLKGKTAPVSFPAKVAVSKKGVSIISDKFSFDRQVFGVAYQSAMADVVIKDEIDLQVKVIAN